MKKHIISGCLLALFTTVLVLPTADAQVKSPGTATDFRPSPIPAEYLIAAEAAFASGHTYFIWADAPGVMKSPGSGTILQIGLRFAVNPKVESTPPFMTRLKLTAIDPQGREIAVWNNAMGEAVSDAKKGDRSKVYANVFLMMVTLKGKGTGTVDLISREKKGDPRSLSNAMTVPIEFE